MSKVILLAPTPPPSGGIASWTVRMMHAKLKNGWRIGVVDEKLMGKRGNYQRKMNLFTEWKRCCLIWKNLRIALRDEDVKVVHSCIPSSFTSMLREYVCAVITKMRKRKFIVHFRCTVPNTTKGKMSTVMLKKLCNKSDLIFLLNQQSVSFVENITETPVRLIPNFSSTDEVCDAHEIKENINTALYVGGVTEEKGCDDIIVVARKFPDVCFHLVGKASLSITEKAEQFPNVVLTGEKNADEVKEELKNADVFLFLTHYYGEGFSNALCEAMAAGLPCIVTDWAANADMIDNDGGIVVEIKDADAAVNALTCISNPEIRKKMSDYNIRKVEKCYIDSIVIDQYVDAYESIVTDN